MTLGFKPIVEIVPQGKQGEAKVQHFEVDKSAARFSALRREYVAAGRYARLLVNGKLVMSDTDMEQRTNWEVVHHANGGVFIAGLGLGMILPPILAKDEVANVWVIEKSQDVIDLVAPHHEHPKLQVVCADAFTWKPPRRTRYDVIYFDIWPDISTDNLPEMERLHRRYGRWLNRGNPRCWMDSWCKAELKSRRRRERREDEQYNRFAKAMRELTAIKREVNTP